MPTVPIHGALLALAVGVAACAWAEPVAVTLPPDTSHLRSSTLPGYAVAQEKCAICHSADYINYQPPGMSLTQWTGVVTKMQHAFGAPVSDDQVKLIGAYLAVTYGSAKASDPAVVALAAPAATTAPDGGDVQALLTANGCLGCHAVDHKVVGPAFQDVAARYKSIPDAQAQVVAHIRSGGQGRWGNIPMPPMSSVTEAQAATLAQYVLSR
jgi:cytochrome c